MRLIDADKLKEEFYNRKRTPDDMKYMRVPAEVVYQFIDNAPTVNVDIKSAIMRDVWELYERYRPFLAVNVCEFGNELKELLNRYERR